MTVKINITGAIVSNDSKEVYEAFGLDSTSPKDVLDKFPKENAPIEIIINSPGGNVFSGFEIYTALREYKGKVTVKIVGLAASAASIIAMAGDEILISPVAQLMIHNVSTIVEGNQHALKQAAEQVEEISRGVCNAYVWRTGKSEEEIQKLMDAETYFSAAKAIEYGLADEIMYTSVQAHKELMTASASTSGILPQSIVDEYLASKEKKRNQKKRRIWNDPFFPIVNNNQKKLFL